MTALVKAAASGGLVQPFAARRAGGAPLRAREAELAEDPRLIAARDEVERLVAELAAVRAEAVAAADAAREAGRREGLAEAAAAEDARLQSLGRALSSAADCLEAKLAAMDELAGALAATALARLLAPDEAMSALVARSVERQMALMRSETVVAIRVSAADFADDAALRTLAAGAGAGPARLVADPALASGDCRIDLTLGHVDLGVAGRWREAAALLAGRAAEEQP